MELAANRWFSSWFDTPYYHILYKNRGDEEAQEFMQNMVEFLKLPKGASILDLACGKGRHSVYLNELGYDVTGVDLSENSISYAKQFENDTLKFYTHCMCTPLKQKFDAVFNLFTSLGYFDEEKENLESIIAIKEEIKEGGWGVIDFMNVKKVIRELVPSEIKKVKGIDFKISRRVENGFILKDIKFEDEGEEYTFTEKVMALTLEKFRLYFFKAGIELVHTFGNYNLEPYDESTSDRLILVFR
ncbi:class I SAM-dependent DNA methyltransferase [Salinimicrobium terrae]|uniref:class I SAM-dependent DNA methyltransferase n=1 Tax=Salinimicrobium terrae TaxID=470866 RepID=UPI00048B8666|nr:class I SAM-dependent methyltransferase [Salinimicrobium terrae]